MLVSKKGESAFIKCIISFRQFCFGQSSLQCGELKDVFVSRHETSKLWHYRYLSRGCDFFDGSSTMETSITGLYDSKATAHHLPTETGIINVREIGVYVRKSL